MRKNYILNFLLFGCIMMFALLGGVTIDRIEKYHDSVKVNIENEYRESLKNELNSVKENLSSDIKANKINIWDDNELKEWFKTNIPTDKLHENLTIVNLGFTIKDYDNVKLNLIKEKYKVSDKIIENIIAETKTHNPNISETPNRNLDKEFTEISKNLSAKYNISAECIKDIIFELFFNKENILFESPNAIKPNTNNFFNEFKIKYLNETKNITLKIDGNNQWVEYILIPDGTLGFNNEPQFYNGKANTNYKKLLILVSLNGDSIIKPYNRLIYNVTNLKYLYYIILFISLIISTVFMCIKIYQFGGDVSVNNCSECNNDYFDELANIILKKLEQLRKR